MVYNIKQQNTTWTKSTTTFKGVFKFDKIVKGEGGLGQLDNDVDSDKLMGVDKSP